jgi:hypothetical protein
MGLISSLRAALVSAIQAAVGRNVSVSKWAGEDVAMASDADAPAIGVQWIGGITDPPEEIGARDHFHNPVFFCFFTTRDDPDGDDGDDRAAELLEAVRLALTDAEIGDAVCRPTTHPALDSQSECFIKAHAGVYLYGQAWRLEYLQEQ